MDISDCDTKRFVMKTIELTEIGCLILSTLVEPTHGYEIMKSIESAFEGQLAIGPATLYTTLSKLVKADLCTFEEVANKKIYKITDGGSKLLVTEVEKRRRTLHFMTQQLEKGGENR